MPVFEPIDQFLLAQVMSAPYLGAEEERELVQAFQETGCTRARDRIVLSHGRMVLKAVKKMAGYGMSETDLFQEGQIGLIEALKRFDLGKRGEVEGDAGPAAGYRFATYASYWVKAMLNDFIMRNQSLVKMGTTAVQKRLFFKLKATVRAIEAEFPHLPRKAVIERAAVQLNCLPAEAAAMFDRLSNADTSLNLRVGESEDGAERGDFLVDPSDTPDVVVGRKIDNERRGSGLMAAVAELDPRSRRVVEARYLVDSDDVATLETLSFEFGVSRERIRQIEQKALQKLKRALSRPVAAPATLSDAEVPVEAIAPTTKSFQIAAHEVVPANEEVDPAKVKHFLGLGMSASSIAAKIGAEAADVMAVIAQQNMRRSRMAHAA